MHPRAIGDAINYEYQCGGDETTLRALALRIRASMDVDSRPAFTDSIEMCGLVLDPPREHDHEDPGTPCEACGESR